MPRPKKETKPEDLWDEPMVENEPSANEEGSFKSKYDERQNGSRSDGGRSSDHADRNEEARHGDRPPRYDSDRYENKRRETYGGGRQEEQRRYDEPRGGRYDHDSFRGRPSDDYRRERPGDDYRRGPERYSEPRGDMYQRRERDDDRGYDQPRRGTFDRGYDRRDDRDRYDDSRYNDRRVRPFDDYRREPPRYEDRGRYDDRQSRYPDDYRRDGPPGPRFGGYRERAPVRQDDAEPNETVGIFNLSRDTTEQDLESALSEKLTDYRGRYSTKLIMDRMTGKCRGFAFLTFESIDEAVKAKDILSGIEVLGHQTRAAFSAGDSRRGSAMPKRGAPEDGHQDRNESANLQ